VTLLADGPPSALCLVHLSCGARDVRSAQQLDLNYARGELILEPPEGRKCGLEEGNTKHPWLAVGSSGNPKGEAREPG